MRGLGWPRGRPREPLIIWLIVFGYLILAKKVRPCDVPEPIHMRQSPTISAAGSVGDFELPARPR